MSKSSQPNNSVLYYRLLNKRSPKPLGLVSDKPEKLYEYIRDYYKVELPENINLFDRDNSSDFYIEKMTEEDYIRRMQAAMDEMSRISQQYQNYMENFDQPGLTSPNE